MRIHTQPMVRDIFAGSGFFWSHLSESRSGLSWLKGTVSRDFLLQVFFMNHDNNIRIISNFFENSRRYSQVKVQICHQFPLCWWHRWQIMGTIWGCRHQKVNLKAKLYIYFSSTTQRWPNKIIKILLIEDFIHLPPVSLTPVANLELRISPRIFEKVRNGLNGIFWGWGETDSWKEPGAKNLVTLSL